MMTITTGRFADSHREGGGDRSSEGDRSRIQFCSKAGTEGVMSTRRRQLPSSRGEGGWEVCPYGEGGCAL